MNLKKLFTAAVVVLLLCEVLLILLSWTLSATMTDGVRSLLSEEGVRWLFGSYTDMLQSQWLVWLLLLSMAAGCLWGSGLLTELRTFYHSYRIRFALRLTLVFLLVYVAVIIMLTAVPHASLLSVTGSLWPSPFSRALIPVLSFGIVLCSMLFGLVSHHFATLSDAVFSLCQGIAKAAPLFLLYVLLMQLLSSFRFAIT